MAVSVVRRVVSPVPIPNSPFTFNPVAYTVPSVISIMVCSMPEATALAYLPTGSGIMVSVFLSTTSPNPNCP